VGLLEVLGVELRVGIVDEFVGTVEPLRFRVRADDGRQQEVVVRVVLRAELFAVVGWSAHAVTSSSAAAAAIAASFSRCLFTGR